MDQTWLDIAPPSRTTRAYAKVEVLGVRELTLADAEASSLPAEKAPVIKRLSERHHALARVLATGQITDGQAAIITGFHHTRVSILRGDPTFQELITFYQAELATFYDTVHEGLSALSKDAVEELRVRLEEDPGSLSVGQLVEVVKMTADRTGHGPQSSSTHINVNIGIADRLQAARDRVQRARVVDLEAVGVEGE